MHIHMGNQLKNHVNNKLFLWCLKKANLIILLANKWMTQFHEFYKEISTPTNVLYNPCEVGPEVPLYEKEKIIIMAALFNDNKAPDLLLKAWGIIKNDCQDWKVYMLGNGEVDRFRKMADDMGLSDSVFFTGYLVGKEKEAFFRKASIYCMCSYEEGFPMLVLEAWAHGICVVSTPVGGLPEITEEGKNILSFDFGDWQRLAGQLKVLIDKPDIRRNMADYSRMFVKSRFSLDKINSEIDNIYTTC